MNLFKSTPDSCFYEISGFDYQTNFISGLLDLSEEYDKFQIAYIDENKEGKSGTLLFIHGHPTWSYIWRHLISLALNHDFRVIAIDLPGFGKSDKPLTKSFFKFENYRKMLLNFIDELKLEDLILVLHEWGGTLGLTLPMENVNLYKGLVCFNSYLGNSKIKINQNYQQWINSNIKNTDLNVRALMARTNRILSLGECNAYEAPFPDDTFKLALNMLPKSFPVSEEADGFEIILEAEDWWSKNKLDKCIVIGAGRDPLVPLEKMKLLSQMISSDEVTHVINNAGHFVPEWGMEFGNELLQQLKDG